MFAARAFSLLEVVIATAIVAAGVTIVLALLATTMKTPASTGGVTTATALADAIQSRLQHEADTGGWDALVNAIPVMISDPATSRSLPWVATRTGEEVRPLSSVEAPEKDQYYLIELRRFVGAPPVAYTAGARSLVIAVTVVWPFRGLTPEGLATATPANERDRVEFNLAITR